MYSEVAAKMDGAMIWQGDPPKKKRGRPRKVPLEPTIHPFVAAEVQWNATRDTLVSAEVRLLQKLVRMHEIDTQLAALPTVGLRAIEVASDNVSGYFAAAVVAELRRREK